MTCQDLHYGTSVLELFGLGTSLCKYEPATKVCIRRHEHRRKELGIVAIADKIINNLVKSYSKQLGREQHVQAQVVVVTLNHETSSFDMADALHSSVVSSSNVLECAYMGIRL